MLMLGVAPGLGAALGDLGVDLRVVDDDARGDLALARALDHDLVAQLGAKARQVQAILAQPLDQLRQRQLVLRGDALDRAVEVGVVDAPAGVAGVGDDHALLDQRVQRLPAQQLRARPRLAGAGGGGEQVVHSALQLAGGHQLLVDHRDDVVPSARRRVAAARLRRCRRESDQGAGGRREDRDTDTPDSIDCCHGERELDGSPRSSRSRR